MAPAFAHIGAASERRTYTLVTDDYLVGTMVPIVRDRGYAFARFGAASMSQAYNIPL